MVAVCGARSRAPVFLSSTGLSTHAQLPPCCLSKTTVGKTKFYQGEGRTQPLCRIEPGTPCQYAREQASELMGDSSLLWAAHYLSALAKALMDDAELGMMR